MKSTEPERRKDVGLAVALGALMAVTGGLVISQAAGRAVQRPRSISPRSKDVGHWTLDRFKAEVFNLGGKRLFDSGPMIGISNQRSAISSQALAES